MQSRKRNLSGSCRLDETYINPEVSIVIYIM